MDTQHSPELRILQSNVTEINNKLTTVMHLLSGNELDQEQGMVHYIKVLRKKDDTLEERISALEKYRDKLKWVIVGLCLPAGAGMAQFLGSLRDMIK